MPDHRPRSRSRLRVRRHRGLSFPVEDIAAVEVAVLVEMIVDRGKDGAEFLESSYISEARHRTFSWSERLVGILGSVRLVSLSKCDL